MKRVKLLVTTLVVLMSFSACGGPKNTELAAQAMERARAAEAPKYAPVEFAKADDLYKKMQEAVKAKNNEEATSLADQTVIAANEATARALERRRLAEGQNKDPQKDAQAKVHKVVKGNTLWGIAGFYYNKRFFLWRNIWTANKAQIKNPDLIYPGQMLDIPPAPPLTNTNR